VRESTCSKSISSEEKAQEERTQRKPFEVSEWTKFRRGSISIMQMRPKRTGLIRESSKGESFKRENLPRERKKRVLRKEK
jgi:hypothetical protein